MARKTIKLDEFKAEATKRFGEDPINWKYVCPKCKQPQSAADLAAAGEKDPDRYIGFSCIGRIDPSQGCDWTLGGLFQIHTVEIEDLEGKRHRHFALADTPAS